MRASFAAHDMESNSITTAFLVIYASILMQIFYVTEELLLMNAINLNILYFEN